MTDQGEPDQDPSRADGTPDNAGEPSICRSTDTVSGDPCQRTVNGGGRCFMHEDDGPPADHGAPQGNGNALRNDGGPPPANGNAERHGLYADRSKYYQRLDDDAKAWVDALVEDWLADAPFGPDNLAGLEMLRKCAIDEHKRRRANELIDDQGIVTENVVGWDDDGDPIVKVEENPANLPYSRLQRDTVKTLKELGVLNDPETQKAEAMADWGTAAKRVAERRDDRDDQATGPQTSARNDRGDADR